jgi:hypothetical protein
MAGEMCVKSSKYLNRKTGQNCETDGISSPQDECFCDWGGTEKSLSHLFTDDSEVSLADDVLRRKLHGLAISPKNRLLLLLIKDPAFVPPEGEVPGDGDLYNEAKINLLWPKMIGPCTEKAGASALDIFNCKGVNDNETPTHQECNNVMKESDPDVAACTYSYSHTAPGSKPSCSTKPGLKLEGVCEVGLGGAGNFCVVKQPTEPGGDVGKTGNCSTPDNCFSDTNEGLWRWRNFGLENCDFEQSDYRKEYIDALIFDNRREENSLAAGSAPDTGIYLYKDKLMGRLDTAEMTPPSNSTELDWETQVINASNLLATNIDGTSWFGPVDDCDYY